MILGLIKKNSGPGFHRIHVPLWLMPNADVFVTNGATEAMFEEKQPTTIFYNRDISDDVLKLQSKYHFKIVVDVDDYWELDASHILYEHHYKNRNNEHLIKHIRLADVITTTHERLAEEIYKINRNVVILPNAIPTHTAFPRYRHPNPSKLTRIFWQGSVTHAPDIDLLKGPMKRLDKNKFAAIIAGYMQGETAWDRMVDAFTNGLQLKGMVLPGASVLEYYKNYAFADIAVCPLVKNKFNGFKSNLKILEAAHIGLPVIASKVDPYLGIDGVMYVEKQSDWYKWFIKCRDRKEFMVSCAKRLHEWVNKHHNFDEINEKRKQVLL